MAKVEELVLASLSPEESKEILAIERMVMRMIFSDIGGAGGAGDDDVADFGGGGGGGGGGAGAKVGSGSGMERDAAPPGSSAPGSSALGSSALGSSGSVVASHATSSALVADHTTRFERESLVISLQNNLESQYLQRLAEATSQMRGAMQVRWL